jgi:hypothetical protein
MPPESYTVPEDRSISAAEAAIVAWLLAHGAESPRYTPLAGSASSLRVVGRCACGCPSIDFVPAGQGIGFQSIANGYAKTPDGRLVGAILWGSETVVSGLEFYEMDEVRPFSLPALSTFTTLPAA